MRIRFLNSAAWLLWISLLVCASGVEAQELTGDEIFRRSGEAYRNLSSYSGTTAVVSEMAFGDTVITGASTAEIYYQRPGRYRVAGRDLAGRPYQVTGDGTGSQVRIVFPGADHANAVQGLLGGDVMGDTLVADSLTSEIALMSVTGIGGRAPFYMPALLGLVRGLPLTRPDEPIQRLGEQPCGVSTCYVLLIDAPTMRATYWVDSSSFLLRRLKQEQTSAAWAAVADELRRSEADRSLAPVLDAMSEEMGATTYLVVFSNVNVDEPLDEALLTGATHGP